MTRSAESLVCAGASGCVWGVGRQRAPSDTRRISHGHELHYEASANSNTSSATCALGRRIEGSLRIKLRF